MRMFGKRLVVSSKQYWVIGNRYIEHTNRLPVTDNRLLLREVMQ